MTIQADAGKTVLVVDDSKVSRMVIKAHILAVHPHWQVVEAGTGDEAVELVARSVPDYCTVDVNMPGMPGTDAAALAAHVAIVHTRSFESSSRMKVRTSSTSELAKLSPVAVARAAVPSAALPAARSTVAFR